MENVRNHKDIKFITTEVIKNYLLSEPNYHTAKYFSDNLLAVEISNSLLRSISNRNQVNSTV